MKKAVDRDKNKSERASRKESKKCESPHTAEVKFSIRATSLTSNGLEISGLWSVMSLRNFCSVLICDSSEMRS